MEPNQDKKRTHLLAFEVMSNRPFSGVSASYVFVDG
jgi:hypothetical protein